MFLTIAAAVVAARLPFLLAADRFFDSDEAVEGLMALHVLRGELPSMFWGQHYKGVPEVYPAAVVFALFGSSVAALKASTLLWHVAFACVQFVLLQEMYSQRVAWLASLFVVAAAPVSVQWSMSGNAEFVLVMLAGTVLLLGWRRWRASGSRAALAIAALALGFGLWVQQFIMYYLVALVVAELLRLGAPARAVAAFFRPRDASTRVRWAIHACLAASGLYLVLGAIAFFDGFTIEIGGLAIGVNHAQKLWRIAAGLLLIATGMRWIAGGALERGSARRTWLIAVSAFLIGYLPALVHRLSSGRSGPIAGMNAEGLADAAGPILTALVPATFGFKSGSLGDLGVPALGAVAIVVVLAAAYARVKGRDPLSVFHVFFVTTPILFVVSGAYVDLQSYRYLLPMWGVLPALFALGVDAIARWRFPAGILAGAALALLFAWQQAAWYRQLGPDLEVERVARCIEGRGITHAYADYWLSYELTFLFGERVIVAQDPSEPLQRYPPYGAAVGAREPVPRFARGADPCPTP